MLAGRQPEGMERSGIPSGEHGVAVQGLKAPCRPAVGTVSGAGIYLIRQMLTDDTPNGFNAINQKLKERIEGQGM